MPRITKPELAQDLTDVFPVLEPRSLSPDEISSTLQLVHPFLLGTFKFRAFNFLSVSSANGVALIDQGPVPADRFWYFLSLSVFHTDPVAKFLELDIVQTGTSAALIGSATALSNLAVLASQRAFLVPPGLSVRGQADSIAAGQHVTMRGVFIEYKLLEPHPGLWARVSASIAQLAEGTRQKVESWRASLRDAGIPHQVTSTRRSLQEQRQLFDRFQRGESLLPAAVPGTSAHEKGRAIDVVFENEDDLADAVELAADAGLDWAGENDPVHFQDPDEAPTVRERIEILGGLGRDVAKERLTAALCSILNVPFLC